MSLTVWTFPCALQDDHRGFRRQLEDKRPIVENNLLSGRQYIANEPPLSDTSDSEGESTDVVCVVICHLSIRARVMSLLNDCKATVLRNMWMKFHLFLKIYIFFFFFRIRYILPMGL